MTGVLWNALDGFTRIARTQSAIAFAVVAYGAHKFLTRQLDGELETLYLLLLGNVLVSLALIGIRYPRSAPELRLLTAGVGLVLGAYVALFPHWLPGEIRSQWPVLTAMLYWGRYAVPVFAVAGLYRPSAVLAVASYVAVLRVAYPYLYELDRVGGSDYIPLIEIGTFVSLSLIVWSLLRRAAEGRRGKAFNPFEILQIRHQALSGIFVMAIGVLMASYFYSGVAKVLLDGTPITWLIHNRTATLVPVTMTTGHLPIGHWPSLTATFYGLLSQLTVMTNAAVLLAEVSAVVAIARKQWIVAAAGVYCAMHMLVFLSSGILFWKWMLLNLIIVLAVRQWRRRHDWSTRLIGALTVLAAPVLPFATMTLAWYETPAVNKFFFEVELDSGQRLELPTNFFGPLSLTPAQMRLGTFGDALWPTRTWGMTWDATERERLLKCDQDLRTSAPAFAPVDWARLEHFFGRVMAFHRENPASPYDVFPHHIFSNPNLFEFTSYLTPRIEKAYYVSESYCVSLEDASGQKLHSVRQEHQIYGS